MSVGRLSVGCGEGLWCVGGCCLVGVGMMFAG